jgi:energy-coupling factor transporter transmembrane protein EcfT
MLARGYSGQMPRLDPLRLARADALFVGLIAVVLVPLRVMA